MTTKRTPSQISRDFATRGCADEVSPREAYLRLIGREIAEYEGWMTCEELAWERHVAEEIEAERRYSAHFDRIGG